LSTCHANGPADALRRLETMVLMGEVGLPLSAVREQVGAALDFVVHVARRAGGHRRIVAVAEVDALGAAVRPIADEHGMVALPSRGARRPGAPAPDPGWVR
jgi:pilus assembly protein CpaF